MQLKRTQAIRRDWLLKTLAGSVLGLSLALGCSAFFVQINADMPLSIKAQLAMWMVAPIWLACLAGSYAFASGWRAWLWLGAANLLIVLLLAALSLF